jgi:hypothetical protein
MVDLIYSQSQFTNPLKALSIYTSNWNNMDQQQNPARNQADAE